MMPQLLAAAFALLAASTEAVPAPVSTAPVLAGKSFCCGPPPAVACGGPDWSPLAFTFNKDATTVEVSIDIDGSKSHCHAEPCTVKGTAVTFALTSKTDCLGKILTGTGALPSDLTVTFDPAKDTLELEVDSEGVDATMNVCK